MTHEHASLEAIRTLTPEQQAEVLRFVDSIRATPPKPRASAYGLIFKFGVNISAEDIDEVHREMWAGSLPEKG